MPVEAERTILRFGPYELNCRTGELLKFGHRLRLQDQPFQILLLLLEKPGDVVTRDELRQQLWRGDTFVDFDHGLNNAIKRLRETLCDSVDKPKYIETLPRRGYRFVGTVETDPTPVEIAAEPTLDVIRPPVPPMSGLRRMAAMAIAVLMVAATVVLLGFRSRFDSVPAIHSIAVLPLQNLSGDASQNYFAEGITDALTTELAQVHSLRVSSRTSAESYRHTDKDIRQIARELGVDAVIEGSIVREGNRVRINAQLIQARTDTHLWAHKYERNMSDILALESEVAGEIAHQVEATVTPTEKARLARPRSVNPGAYDLYLKARFCSQTLNRAENDCAIALLEQAVSADPTFAQAYAALALEYRTRAVDLRRSDDEWDQKAYVAAQRAVDLDPQLADGYTARGTLLWTAPNHYPHEAAIQELKQAIDLNPNADEAHHQLANIYNHIGLLDQAREQIGIAERENPGNPGTRFRVAINLIYSGEYEQALDRIRSSRDFMPSLWAFQTSFALVQLGRTDEAERLLRDSETNDHTETAALLRSMEAVVAARLGDTARADRKITEAIAMGSGFQHFHHTEYGIASAYALMNRRRESLQWLKRAAEDGFPCYPLYAHDRNLQNLRNDPQFVAFMTELQAQWQHYRESL